MATPHTDTQIAEISKWLVQHRTETGWPSCHVSKDGEVTIHWRPADDVPSQYQLSLERRLGKGSKR